METVVVITLTELKHWLWAQHPAKSPLVWIVLLPSPEHALLLSLKGERSVSRSPSLSLSPCFLTFPFSLFPSFSLPLFPSLCFSLPSPSPSPLSLHTCINVWLRRERAEESSMWEWAMSFRTMRLGQQRHAFWDSRFLNKASWLCRKGIVGTRNTNQAMERRKEIQTGLAALPGVSDSDIKDSWISFSGSLSLLE